MTTGKTFPSYKYDKTCTLVKRKIIIFSLSPFKERINSLNIPHQFMLCFQFGCNCLSFCVKYFFQTCQSYFLLCRYCGCPPKMLIEIGSVVQKDHILCIRQWQYNYVYFRFCNHMPFWTDTIVLFKASCLHVACPFIWTNGNSLQLKCAMPRLVKTGSEAMK